MPIRVHTYNVKTVALCLFILRFTNLNFHLFHLTIMILCIGERWREFPIAIAPELNDFLKDFDTMKRSSERFFHAKKYDVYRTRLDYGVEQIGVNESFIKLHSIRKLAEMRWREQRIPVEVRSLLAGHSIAVQVSRYLKQPSSREIMDMIGRDG